MAATQRGDARARREPIRRTLEIVDGRAYVGDRFLLCSDGLTTHVEDDEIAALLGADEPQKACDALLH